MKHPCALIGVTALAGTSPALAETEEERVHIGDFADASANCELMTPLFGNPGSSGGGFALNGSSEAVGFARSLEHDTPSQSKDSDRQPGNCLTAALPLAPSVMTPKAIAFEWSPGKASTFVALADENGNPAVPPNTQMNAQHLAASPNLHASLNRTDEDQQLASDTEPIVHARGFSGYDASLGPANGSRFFVEVSSMGPMACPTVTLRFSGPIRYSGISPTNPALAVQLQVEPVGPSEYVRRDRLDPPEGTDLVRSIDYVADAAAGPTVSLTFGKLTRVTIALGHDPQSLLLNLEDTSVPDACAAPTNDTAEVPELDRAELEWLQTEAESAIMRGDLATASVSLDRILASAENDYTPRALELTGLIAERRGQPGVARQRYEEHLRRFPGHEANGRVRERLAGLPAAPSGTAAPGDRVAAGQERGKWRFDVSGGFSQFYSRDESRNVFIDARRPEVAPFVDERINVDQLLSTLDAIVSGSNGRTRITARAAGAYTLDFRPVTLVGSSRSSGDDTQRVYSLYVDARDEVTGLFGRLGRQPQFGSGVFGRFDGAQIGWRFSPAVSVTAQGGYPVYSTRTDYKIRDRWFYGFNLNYAPDDSPLDLTAYWFDQRTHGMIDRQAIGFEARYRSDTVSIFGLIDYDLKFQKVSHFYLSANLPFENGSSLSIQADQQYYPPLALTNAVIGQPVPKIEEMKRFFTEGQLRKIAEDRSARSRNFNITYSHPLSDKWLANVDFTLANTNGTPASVGVEATEDTGTEVYAGAQLVGHNLVTSGDTVFFGARYAETARFHIYAGELGGRLPVAPKFGIEPRIRVARREDKFGPGHQTSWRPNLRATFEASDRVAFDAEIGYVWFKQRHADAAFVGHSEEEATIFNIGYRLSF